MQSVFVILTRIQQRFTARNILHHNLTRYCSSVSPSFKIQQSINRVQYDEQCSRGKACSSSDFQQAQSDEYLLSPEKELLSESCHITDSDDASHRGVTIVRDRTTALRVVVQLMRLPQDNPVAWDTETTGVNPVAESPVFNGRVICATAYAGDHVDFGSGPRLFIDCLDGDGDLLQVFKPYFESNDFPKVWHHYSFDRHVLSNHDIVPRGFAGDTMHMARLVNSTHTRVSLEQLSNTYLDTPKKSLLNLFGTPEKLRNGSDGKKLVIPSTIQLQRDEKSRPIWIDYATTDAELTHRLFYSFKARLSSMEVKGANSVSTLKDRFPDLLTLYRKVLLPFGELLTEMERNGFKVDVPFLQQAEQKADSDRQKLVDEFLKWAQKHSPDTRYMNVNSDQQKLQLFFSPCTNATTNSKVLSESKVFSVELTGVQRQRYLDELSRSECPTDRELLGKISTGKRKAKKNITIFGLGKTHRGLTSSGWPSVSADAMRKLAGRPRDDPPTFGDTDKELCFAVDDMIEATAISSLLTNFIGPLQQWPGKDGRIHASLNLNTETGRLSSRRPNLQNQPALEKDRYKVRKAFTCEEGNKLIVADYGQLELRLLAHITKCQSMIDAFKAGGDFHSRTALTMFDHVKSAVDAGECVLERDGSNHIISAVLPLKEMFPVERRKAKTLNFSIAYGKTAVGLARDWNVSKEDAYETLSLWYKDRQEVKRWQDDCKRFLSKYGYVETLFGRRRHLPDVKDPWKRAHAQRAAINAPLQGSAADLVMAAMIGLHNSPILRVLGWRIVLQVHDEIILEGPSESASAALPEIVAVMKNPIDAELLVDLTVDAKVASSWYDAK